MPDIERRPEPTPLVRDVGGSAFGLLLSSAFGAAAIAALVWGHWIGFLVVGGFATFLGVSALKARKGKCPSCGAVIPSVSGKFERCPSCDAWSVAGEGTLSPMAPDFRSTSPSIQVPLSHLGDPPGWKWPWAGRCAVCGGSATRSLDLAVKKLTAVIGPMAQQTRWTFAVPHCSQHENGIGFNDSAADAMLGFQSYEHYRAFLAANRLRR